MILDGWTEWLGKRRFYVVWLLVGFALVGVGLIWWKTSEDQPQAIQVLSASEVELVNEGNELQLVVDVSGAVIAPGVYYLQSGSRIQQAIEAAGGLSDKANYEWIDKNLNRSQKLADGQKVYIPFQGGSTLDSKAQSKSTAINLNEASAAELDKLPGIGSVTASKVITGRPYGKKEELVERKIVSSKVWENIKELVDVW